MVFEDGIFPAAVEDFVMETKRPVTDAETNQLVKYLLSGLISGKIVFRNNFDSVKDNFTDSRIIGERLRPFMKNKSNSLKGYPDEVDLVGGSW